MAAGCGMGWGEMHWYGARETCREGRRWWRWWWYITYSAYCRSVVFSWINCSILFVSIWLSLYVYLIEPRPARPSAAAAYLATSLSRGWILFRISRILRQAITRARVRREFRSRRSFQSSIRPESLRSCSSAGSRCFICRYYQKYKSSKLLTPLCLYKCYTTRDLKEINRETKCRVTLFWRRHFYRILLYNFFVTS